MDQSASYGRTLYLMMICSKYVFMQNIGIANSTDCINSTMIEFLVSYG